MSYRTKKEIRENMADTIINPFGGTISTDSMFSYDYSSSSTKKYIIGIVVCIIILIILWFVYKKYMENNNINE